MAELPPDYLDVPAWDRWIQQSPRDALGAARAILDGDPADALHRIRAQYAAGRALLELGMLVEAAAVLRDAIEAMATDDRLAEDRTSLLMTAAIVFAETGDIERALSSLDVLGRGMGGAPLGRVLLQRAVVLHHAGRLTEALSALDHSDRLIAVAGDDRDRLRVHLNRGVVLLQHGDLQGAETDFLAAARLANGLGMTVAEAQCHANRGALYGRARRLFEALRAFELAESLLDGAARSERVMTGMEIDRAEVMMHSGLHDDAVAAAHRALAAAHASGNDVTIGDALLMCARTELLAGSARNARRTALVARAQLLDAGRDDMVAHADALAARGDLEAASGADVRATFDRSREVEDRLRELGWNEQADALIADRLRTAWRLEAWDLVVDDLADLRLHAFGTRRDLALLGWFAEAVARRLGGDAPGSVDACRKGLSFLDDITSEATDLEARSAAIRLGNDLSRWIIEVAVAQHDADLVLAASEGTRARALHEELAGREQHRPLSDEGADRLRAELRGRLSGRCLVQWVIAGERVHAVVCDETGNRVLDVAELRSVVRERDRVMMWLDRAAAEPDDSSARALRAAGLLDELLLGPLGLPGDDSVIIVPVDELHGVPWSGLPSIADRPVVLSPSCRLWLDADRRASSPIRSVGFVAGPNVGADDLERMALRRNHDRVDEATGAGATAATVRTMFGGHDLVHVAAHGRFRADRPLLSTFELADGEVTLHESVPDRVGARLAVLSSCEGGAHRGATGSEVLGLASVLLARGAASVLAPLTVVRDLECGEFVSAVHDEMANGTRFGSAVADVRGRWLRDDDLSRWAVASSFTCFGSGATRQSSD